jgi:hypothetical protein
VRRRLGMGWEEAWEMGGGWGRGTELIRIVFVVWRERGRNIWFEIRQREDGGQLEFRSKQV